MCECCNVYELNTRWGRVKGKPGAGISLLFLKSTKGAARINVPPEWRIVINNKYAFISYALRRDIGFSPGIFGTEISNWVSAIPSLLVSRRDIFLIKIPTRPGSNPITLCARQWLWYCSRHILKHYLRNDWKESVQRSRKIKEKWAG